MWQLIKRSLWVLLLASGLQSSWAYSLAGPVGNGGDAWQSPVIGYGPPTSLVGPKNIGEEYRRNTPVLYWTFDQSFYDFFGTNGANALRSTFAVLNSLTNVDNYSPQLSEFPLETRHINFTAQTLGLFDVKSFTLGILAEQMGLADPVEWTWTLHDRNGTPCPAGMAYLVVQRNFDFVSDPLNQLQYSPYVNNTLYSYSILEFCTGPNPLALAVPFSVDPLADTYSAVASSVIGWGDYYTGLTRDDVAGLRYLLTTNNVNYENVAPGALLVTTNLGSIVQLTTSNLNSLLVFAQTNDPSLIPGAFPNVVVASAVTNWVLVTNWSIGSYLYTPPGQPYGTQVLVVYSNIVGTSYQPVYQDTFANVITNGNLTNFPGFVLTGTNVVLNYSPYTVATMQTVQLLPVQGAPYGTLATNTTSSTVIFSNTPSGEYFVLPPGQCGWRILDYPPAFQIVNTTNLITQATNTFATGGTNNATTNTFVGSESIVYTFTNHTYLAQPINCVNSTPPPGLYEGIGRVQFVEADFDSLIGQYFQPVTNNYTMTLVTNSQTVVQNFQRVVTTPDFLFDAADLVSGPAAPPVVGIYARNLNFDTTRVLPGLAGPGIITPSTTVTYNKSGPVYYNSFSDVMDGTPYFTQLPGSDLTDLFYAGYFVWASYDGTTNAPVVYPNGTSVDILQNQMLIQVTPSSLSDGYTDTPYGPVTFSTTGGAFTQPYTWSASGLPAGMSLASNPDSTATLSGSPSQSGTFDFILTLTDYVGRSVRWGYTITIQ